MRSTTTVTVCACFAELTSPTRVRRRDRRHECGAASCAEPVAAGARRSGRARLTMALAAGLGAAGAVALATVFFGAAFAVVFLTAAVVFFAAVFFSAVAAVFLAVVFFSAI